MAWDHAHASEREERAGRSYCETRNFVDASGRSRWGNECAGVPFCPWWVEIAMGGLTSECNLRVGNLLVAASTLRSGATVQAWLVHCATEYVQQDG
jgi:hypothetical protein